MSLEIGSRLGSIRVGLLLGKGGMSEVYLGIDEANQRMVALKIIQNRRLDPLARVRFLREAEILSRLDHPDICKVYDLISGPNADVMVLELVEGKDLRQAMASGLTYRTRLQIAERLAGVLAVAHSHGIVHRDLKPENVMCTNDGRIKVLDFDLARPAHSVVTRQASSPPPVLTSGNNNITVDLSEVDTDELRTTAGSIVGTVPYMSPEQARGEPLTVASDCYSLGVVLHELFTGESAYRGEHSITARLLQVCRGETQPVKGLDPDLTELIEALKRLDPKDRPAAAEAVQRLQRLKERAGRPRTGMRRLLDRVRRRSS